MKHDSVIFDMDGTLLNTLGDLHSAVNAVMDMYSFPRRTLDEVRRFVGNGVKVLVDLSVPDGTDGETAARVLADFKEYYSLHSMETTSVYPGVAELLRKLKEQGVKTAIVSNKIDPAVKKLSELFFPGLVGEAIGEKQGIAKKPKPDSVFEAMRILGVKNPVYVGDSEVDVQTAKNAGIDGAFVTWGFRSREELISAGADESRIADTAQELYKLL